MREHTQELPQDLQIEHSYSILAATIGEQIWQQVDDLMSAVPNIPEIQAVPGASLFETIAENLDRKSRGKCV